MSYEECLTLEELSERVGIKPRTIRDYRQRGLLPSARRQGNKLYFGDRHVDALSRIVSLQRRGLNLAAIKALVGDMGGGEGVRCGIRFLALSDLATLTVLRRWRIVRGVGCSGEFEWSGGQGLLTALKRLEELDVDAVRGLRLTAGLLKNDLIGSGSLVGLLRRVELDTRPLAVHRLVRHEAFHDLVGQLVRWQLGMWSETTCHRSMSQLDSRSG